MKKITLSIALIIMLLSNASIHAIAAEMNHSAMMTHAPSTLPTEAGNAAFGTIQEVIILLNNDPNTDWSTVNLEALRLHLLDMEDMTSNVEVISQTPIKNGMIAIVKPTTERAAKALKRIFKVHPKVLKSESGFDMQVTFTNGQYSLSTTTKNSAEIDKIRGLGYIGLMAYGNHHQPHHLSMAKGSNPHGGHAHH